MSTQTSKGAIHQRQTRAVGTYLRDLGKPDTPPEWNIHKANQIEEILSTGGLDVLRKLDLVQRHMNLITPPKAAQYREDRFIEHARAYSERTQVSREAWLEVGVPVKVLRKAGIK